ncbi:MAG TPA: ABC transporter ATP-binding protein, partial [Bradyrhizobium sp.]
MAPKPPSSDDQIPDSAEKPVAPELDQKLAAGADRVIGDKTAGSPPPDDEAEDDDELDIDDEDDDEDLVVFTAKEAAGALATVYAFVKPYLKNYKKILAFVGLGVLVETLFNVIMPLSLKFLIDDALGEEDFEALVKILSVLAAAGIVTSVVAVWYERWDAELAATLISDVR